MIFHSSAPLHFRSALYNSGSALVSQPKGLRFKSRKFVKFYIFDDFPQISTVKDFNFQLFGVLRVSPVRFDGSPSWYLTFYLNLSGRGVEH